MFIQEAILVGPLVAQGSTCLCSVHLTQNNVFIEIPRHIGRVNGSYRPWLALTETIPHFLVYILQQMTRFDTCHIEGDKFTSKFATISPLAARRSSY